MQQAQNLVFLKGKKTVLRPPSKDDLARVVRWINDPEVRYYLESYLPITEGEEEEWLANIAKRKPYDIVLALETLEGIHIGNMGLHRIHWRDRVATTGALIGEKEYWGRGYGTDAKMVLLNYAFNTLNLRKICSQVLAFNERSRRYSEKCGYKLEGVLKKHIFRNGQYWDLLQLAVFQEDFAPYWEEYSNSTIQTPE